MMHAADGNFSGRLCGLRLPNSLSEKAGTPLAVFLPCAVWRCLRYVHGKLNSRYRDRYGADDDSFGEEEMEQA